MKLLWIPGKAEAGIAQSAKKLWRPGFVWMDIARLTFTASQPKNVRSFAEPMVICISEFISELSLKKTYNEINKLTAIPEWITSGIWIAS